MCSVHCWTDMGHNSHTGNNPRAHLYAAAGTGERVYTVHLYLHTYTHTHTQFAAHIHFRASFCLLNKCVLQLQALLQRTILGAYCVCVWAMVIRRIWYLTNFAFTSHKSFVLRYAVCVIITILLNGIIWMDCISNATRAKCARLYLPTISSVPDSRPTWLKSLRPNENNFWTIVDLMMTDGFFYSGMHELTGCPSQYKQVCTRTNGNVLLQKRTID